jgi:L-aspartate oxidase
MKERFMEDYHPMAELAPRDIVSRAIISEMVKTRSDYVYLELTHLGKEFLKKRFPRIYSTCLQYNIDITRELVPVSPAAHYIMGGVKTDTGGGTNIRRLYAAGEVACTGVHGANRLASNSLLEGLVYGARAGKTALDSTVKKEQISLSSKNIIQHPTFTSQLISIPDHEEMRHELRRLMWERVGIIRCGESLGYAKERLAEWSFIHEITPLTRRELELKNMQVIARLITEASLQRKGSAGAHYRSDYPERGEGWQKHTAWRMREGVVTYEGVE